MVFINSDAGFTVVNQLLNAVANVYNWKGMATQAKPIIKETVELTPVMVDKYTGVYKEPNGLLIVVTQKDGSLWYRAGGSFTWKMYFTSPDTFINLESKSEKQFYTSGDRKVTGFYRSLDGKELAKAEKLTILQLPDNTLQQYAGTYAADDGNSSEVIIKDKTLWLKVEEQQKKI